MEDHHEHVKALEKSRLEYRVPQPPYRTVGIGNLIVERKPRRRAICLLRHIMSAVLFILELPFKAREFVRSHFR